MSKMRNALMRAGTYYHTIGRQGAYGWRPKGWKPVRELPIDQPGTLWHYDTFTPEFDGVYLQNHTPEVGTQFTGYTTTCSGNLRLYNDLAASEMVMNTGGAVSYHCPATTIPKTIGAAQFDCFFQMRRAASSTNQYLQIRGFGLGVSTISQNIYIRTPTAGWFSQSIGLNIFNDFYSVYPYRITYDGTRARFYMSRSNYGTNPVLRYEEVCDPDDNELWFMLRHGDTHGAIDNLTIYTGGWNPAFGSF